MTETNDASSVRREWMGMMGFSPDEIDQDCIIHPPMNIDEELQEYNATLAIVQATAMDTIGDAGL